LGGYNGGQYQQGWQDCVHSTFLPIYGRPYIPSSNVHINRVAHDIPAAVPTPRPDWSPSGNRDARPPQTPASVLWTFRIPGRAEGYFGRDPRLGPDSEKRHGVSGTIGPSGRGVA
jgi:hypothetical protein